MEICVTHYREIVENKIYRNIKFNEPVIIKESEIDSFKKYLSQKRPDYIAIDFSYKYKMQ